ncbi:MAG: tRNA preQ1(34) S-adenosylmethionine ribosyltransferase-isomerase QueA, partial [Chloroflexota bacterium]|nr:tRNA preQ1(34) S-adenosylmethionine ribosyltransferase-isomerase QueA [Chloroflexota bacterium]
MRTADFDYYLPKELIAQTPQEPRDHSRLLVLSRAQGTLEHRRFFELGDYLNPGDLLVCNDSRVLPARLFGHWEDSGGKVEVFLLRQMEAELWEVLLKRGRRGKPGAGIVLGSHRAEVTARASDGSFILRFPEGPPLDLGVIPLPPYIHSPLADPERYQTVYARPQGSVAAPTAGLHFTPSLMASLREKGVRFAFVTLHVGWGSFRPVRAEDPRQHTLHQEYGEIGEEAAREISGARAEGRRIIVVGTTSVRLLEEAALAQGLGGEGT